MNVFDFALKMEQDGRTFYEKLAREAHEAELQQIFTLLAELEQEHHDVLVALKEKADPAQAESKALTGVKTSFGSLLARKNSLATLKGDVDGYRQAIKAEEESIRLYEDLAAKEEDATVKKYLLQIAEEEKRHLNMMENIYEFMESPKTYLAWGEFSNLQGI